MRCPTEAKSGTAGNRLPRLRKGTFFAQIFMLDMATSGQSQHLPKHAENDLLKNGGCE